MLGYTHINSFKVIPLSFNVGVAFLFLFLFFSNSFSLVTSYYASGPGACTGGSASMACSFNRNNGACAAGSPAPSLPPGSTFSDAFVVGYASGGCGDDCSVTGINSVSCQAPPPTITDGRPVTWFVRCQCFFSVISNNGSLPSCSDPALISDSRCEGGQALWAVYDNTSIGSLGSVGNVVPPSDAWNSGQLFQVKTSNGFDGFLDGRHYNMDEEGGVFDAPWIRPDGSLCSTGATSFFALTVCPLGFAQSSSSSEASSSSAESSSSEAPSSSAGLPSSSSCKIVVDGICMDMPDNCRVMVNGVCVDSPPDSCAIKIDGVCIGDVNGDCRNLNNCNWSRIDVQLEQFGVEKEIRDKIKDLHALQEKGYNLSVEQKNILNDVITAVNSGSANTVSAINGMGVRLDNLNANLGFKLDGLGGKLEGIGGKLDSLKGGIGDAIMEGLNKFAGDTSGTGDFNNSLADYGNGSGSAMGDSLGNGLVAKNAIKNAVKIDSTNFKFLGNSEKCPVWDFSFRANVGKWELGCTSAKCKISICDIYGFNLGTFFRALIWLSAMVGILYMNLSVLRTGGH